MTRAEELRKVFAPTRTKPAPAEPAFKRERTSSTIPESVRAEVRARSGGRCEAQLAGCTGEATEMHHRLRSSHGGPSIAANLLHLCGPFGPFDGCHRRIHANPADSYESGLLIRDGVDAIEQARIPWEGNR